MAKFSLILYSLLAVIGGPNETVLKIDANTVIHRVSPLLYGACIEDVNHEIYGGLYSQMIFGESFQEPERPQPLKGFTAYGGTWLTREGEVRARPGDGPKLVSDEPGFAVGEVGVEIMLEGDLPGNAGLIVKVDKPDRGADAFTGYEVSLETSGNLVLGRHRRNWEPLRRVPCSVPPDRWISLVVRMKEKSLEVIVDGKSLLTYEDSEHPLAAGRVGLRTWQRPARYRDLSIKTGDSHRKLAFEPKAGGELGGGVSGMWSAVQKGSARGEFAIESRHPFVGQQSQSLTFREGEGELGIENRGLNRWGLNIVAGKPYEGYLLVRAAAPTTLALALESGDGSRVLGDTTLEIRGEGWNRYGFIITPREADSKGRFAIKLRKPGSVTVGHAFLQPGEWGRFHGLPDRKDVAEALVDQGITVLRYGGSMINHAKYRWKKMIGPRELRPPSAGTWYPYSSNGWGIFDFLNFCEAAGFVAIPALNMGESPQDMADFVEYANGPAQSVWGRRRVADGHPEPYRLKHVELGNEEAVNEDYFVKFKAIADAMWAKDSALILIVGDFAYGKVIDDPFNFSGGVAVNTLAAHKKILELAKARGREVWFDIHVSTDHPPEPNGLLPERSYIEQLGRIAPGAKYKVVVFEYNSGNHAVKRALSNALATNEVERIGDLLPMACSANCLQPDGQNDNAWDQGLLFLNPSKVWLQPPGYVLQMTRRNFQPLLVKSEVQGPSDKLSVNVKKSEDGKTLVVQVVNWGESARPVQIEIEGISPRKATATVEQLSGPLEGVNPAEESTRIVPRKSEWKHELAGGRAAFSFPAHSVTMLRIE